MLPSGSAITFTGTASATLYVDTVDYEFVVEPFDRMEFSNQRLRGAPTSNGTLPIIVQSFGNKPIQLASTCTGDSPRPLGPDDSNISSIKQQFNIHRYSIGGAASLPADVDAIYTIAQNHIGTRLSNFNNHIEKTQMELSYAYLVTMQSSTFSNVTTTGLTVAGVSLGGTINNILITQFSPGVLYTNTRSGSVIRGWKMVFDVRTISSRS